MIFEKCLEEGGFRTDAPTCAQISFHCFCSNAVHRKWQIRSFDVSTAFLTGDKQTRKLYCRPPTRGLPGVHPECLLEVNTGVYGLREAPRLWYQAADRKLTSCGWEELKIARSTYICRDPHTGMVVGMLLLYVDDACYGGSGPHYEHVVNQTHKQFNIGKKFETEFDFLGRHVKQYSDFRIEVDMDKYIRSLEKVVIPTARRNQPKSPLTPTELHQYRSITGQLAWPARNVMPQLAYSVSDLQQKTSKATVHDLHHCNKVFEWCKRWALIDKQRLKFLPFKGPVSVDMVYTEHDSNKRSHRKAERLRKLGLAAVHDASFAGQPDYGSQGGYVIMLGDTKLYNEPATTHLIEWHSGKIHRKVASTLASEAVSYTHLTLPTKA